MRRTNCVLVIFPHQLPDIVESEETKVAEEGDVVDLGEVGQQEDAGGGGQLAHRAPHQTQGHRGGDDEMMLNL